MRKSESNPGANSGSQPTGDSSGKRFILAILGIFVIGGLGIAAAVTLAGDDDIDDVDQAAPVETTQDTAPQTDTDQTGTTVKIEDAAAETLDGDGVAVTLDGGIDSIVSATGSVEISGDSLPAMVTGMAVTTADTDKAIGTTAPEIVGTNFADEEVSITADGRTKAIYFIAHWCPHCQVEVPMLTSLQASDSIPAGLDIYAVSTAVSPAQGNYPPHLWLEEEEWTLPVIRDNVVSDALTAYGSGGFPYVVYLDGNNEVLFRTTGSLDASTTVELWNQAVSLSSSAG